MFHTLIKLTTFPKLIRSPYLLIKINTPRNALFRCSNRYYCQGSSGDSGIKGPKGPCNKDKKGDKGNVCVTARRKPVTCKPPTARPCLPRPPPNRLGPNKCPPRSKMDQLPVPACPWNKANEEQNKKYTKHLLWGLLAAAASLLALWYNTNLTKPPAPKKKQRMFKRPKPKCKLPQENEQLPDHAPYLLIGGGTASFSAFRAIKSSDPTAKVLVISNECYFPYMRPPLSKEMWINKDEKNVAKLIFKQWNGTERSLFYEPEDFYINPEQLAKSDKGGVAVARGYEVTKIDVVEKIAYLDSGKQITYDKCLIASGASPKNLDVFKTAKPEIQDKVTLYRDIWDYQELDEICKDAKAIAIIGGGFLGSEIACALGKTSRNQYDVYQIFREDGNMGKVLPEYLSKWTTNKIRKESVKIMNKTEVEDVSLGPNKDLVLHLNNGEELSVDHVIVAVGVEPNTQLAKTSDLEVDPKLNGYLVNAEMEARSNLYVAGDCSCFYDVKLGRRRVEHHDHAVVSGRLAGENMTGSAKPYLHQSMFWSDLGPEVGYEAIGLIDSTLPTVAVFAKATDKDNPKAVVTATNESMRSKTEADAKPPTTTTNAEPTEQCNADEYGKGVIFYLRDEIVVGILLWNVFNRMSIARQVLKDDKKYNDLNEVAKLFHIHED